MLLLVQLASIAFSFSHPQCLCVGVFMKRAACYDMPECGELEPKSWLHREKSGSSLSLVVFHYKAGIHRRTTWAMQGPMGLAWTFRAISFYKGPQYEQL